MTKVVGPIGDDWVVPKYGLSEEGLERFFLFCVAVAGKGAITTSAAMNRWREGCQITPFGQVRALFENSGMEGLRESIKAAGFGQHTRIARAWQWAAVYMPQCYGWDWMHKLHRDELLEIPGVGLKTASFFVLHTRRGAKVACLDRHILRFIKSDFEKQGAMMLARCVPDATPSSRSLYLDLEAHFLRLAEVQGMTPAELDWEIWSRASGSKDLNPYTGAPPPGVAP